MIEVEIYEKNRKFYWQMFFGTGILGGLADTQEYAFCSIYDVIRLQSQKYPAKDVFPLVFRMYDNYSGFMGFLQLRYPVWYKKWQNCIMFVPGAWKNNPGWVHSNKANEVVAMKNFTPESWRCIPCESEPKFKIVDGTGRIIALVTDSMEIRREESLQNGHLMATSPKMYKKLEELRQLFRWGSVNSEPFITNQREAAAIEKILQEARGEK